MKAIVPTEESEQVAVCQYLESKHLAYWHTPNSTFTKSWSVKKRNTRLGTKSGIPDLFVIINNKLYGIEMKRRSGGVVSKSQKQWIKILNDSGVETIVANGADEAIEYIESISNRLDVDIF